MSTYNNLFTRGKVAQDNKNIAHVQSVVDITRVAELRCSVFTSREMAVNATDGWHLKASFKFEFACTSAYISHSVLQPIPPTTQTFSSTGTSHST
jgi:hypothetical protein